jgi:hypothetical protein
MNEKQTETTDRLRMDYINSLPQPFLVRLCGDKTKWQLVDIDVQTGLLRFDVCGKLQVGHIGEVAEFIDAEGNSHEPDSFYWEASSTTKSPTIHSGFKLVPNEPTKEMISRGRYAYLCALEEGKKNHRGVRRRI